MRVGVAQIDIKLFDIESNVQKHLDYIKKAKELDIELLVFPELSLTGYHIQDKILDMGMTLENKYVNLLVEASDGIRIIFGIPEEERNAVLYNSSITVYNKKIEFVHRKNNLPNYGKFIEKAIFAPSKEVHNFSVNDQWKYAVLICADMWDPSLVHNTMLEDTNLLISPFNGGITEENITNIKNWQKCFDFYSMMYESYIIGANRVGGEKEFKFFGNSVIMDPHGEVLAIAKTEEEDLIYADIDYQEIRKARVYAPNIKNLL